MSCANSNATGNSPSLNFTVQIDNPGSYTVWARGMAPDAGGDSLHVGVNGGTPSTAANLTGFTPNQWSWSRLTMSNTNATLDLSSGGTFTLNVSMREDGLRLDKLMLVTDTATIPTGQGPLESPTTTALPNLVSYTIQYGYDPLYRLTNVAYSGDITATYQYDYNEVGNRTTYTATITATQVTTYTYNAANQLITAKEVSSPDIWYYVYDGNGNLVRQVPNGLTAADGEVRYTFNQRNLLVQIENHDGSSYLPQAEMNYDGAGNRLQGVSFVLGSAMTTTYTLDSLNNRLPLAVDNGTDSRTILYGLFGLGEFSTEWTFYLGDGQLSVRQLMDGSGNIALSRTYGPFGQILQEAGNGSAIYGFAGAQAGGGGLLYINGRYFDPATGRFLSPDNNFDPMRPGTLNGYLSAAFLFAPFGVIIWRKRKKRGGRYDLMLFLMLGIGLGMILVSCGGSEDGGGTPTFNWNRGTIVPSVPPNLALTPSVPTQSEPIACTDGYETDECPRHRSWNAHKQRMQERLDMVSRKVGVAGEEIAYAPETPVLQAKGLVVEGGKAAVPIVGNEAMFIAMTTKGEEFVRAIEAEVAQGNTRLNYSCNDTVGLVLSVDDLVGFGARNLEDYNNNFTFDSVVNPEVAIYRFGTDPTFIMGHSAIIAYEHPSNPSLNITVQTDGSATSSGIFFIHVRDSQYFPHATVMYGKRK